jgi:hypothetical protein
MGASDELITVQQVHLNITVLEPHAMVRFNDAGCVGFGEAVSVIPESPSRQGLRRQYSGAEDCHQVRANAVLPPHQSLIGQSLVFL